MFPVAILDIYNMAVRDWCYQKVSTAVSLIFVQLRTDHSRKINNQQDVTGRHGGSRFFKKLPISNLGINVFPLIRDWTD